MKNTFRLLLVMICLFVNMTPMDAQWVCTNGPYGARISAFGCMGSNFFAATNNGGIFRTTDSCANWSGVHSGLPPQSGITSILARGTDLFIGTYQGEVFRSIDAGATWTLVYKRPGETIAVLASVGQTVFASANIGIPGLYRTTTDDSTWVRCGELANSMALIGSNLLASFSNGVFVSTNTGADWNSVVGLQTPGTFAIGGSDVYFATPHGILLSTDSGASWTPRNNGLPYGGETYIYYIAANETDVFTVPYSPSQKDSMYYSTDKGATWSQTSTGLTPGLFFSALSFQGKNAVAGTSNGVYVSSDHGASWNVMSQGLSTPGVLSLAAAPISGDTELPILIAGTDNGLYRSINNGIKWEPVLGGIGVSSLAVRGSNIIAARGGGWGMYRSSDGGSNWNPIGSFPTTVSLLALAVSGTNLFAGSNGQVYRSTDDGSNWASTSMPTWTLVNALAVNDPYLLAGSYYTGALLSTNNGANWKKINNGLTDTSVYALAILGENFFAGTRDSGVFRSTDFGSTWTQMNSGLTSRSVWSFAVSGKYLFAGTSAGVFASSDKGMNWNEINTGLTGDIVDVLCVNGTDLLAGVASGNAPFLTGGVWRRPISEVTSAPAPSLKAPLKFTLEQNYPNPFNPATIITFSVPSKSFVSLRVFDVLGREVATLATGEYSPGIYKSEWNANGFSSGVYFCRLHAGSLTDTKKLVFLR